MARPLLPTVAQSKMTQALTGLKDADRFLLSAITELREQNFTTPADDLQVVLNSLRTETDAAVAAVNI